MYVATVIKLYGRLKDLTFCGLQTQLAIITNIQYSDYGINP